MDMNAYQSKAYNTAIYPLEHSKSYPLFGLMGEVGEFANKYKKVLRDGKRFTEEELVSELGDILWYFAVLCGDHGLQLGEVARANIEKLQSRKQRGVLGGSGDNR